MTAMPLSDTIDRRHYLRQIAGGFLGTALAAMFAEEQKLYASAKGLERAKSVIYLFMCGGVSHLDTFDPKGNKWAGKLIDAVGFGDNQAEMKRPVIPCRRQFQPYGESGIPVSDWFPHVGEMVDEMAIIRSMYCHEVNHFPAVVEMATGHRRRLFEHPCLGSWVSYALGTENRDLPSFVNLGRPSSPLQLTGGYLGAVHAGTPFQQGPIPIPNLRSPTSRSVTQREDALHVLAALNQRFRERYRTDLAIAARQRAYELAAGMQLEAPDIVDLSTEPAHVLAMYGVGEEPTDSFGKQLLLARRLAENGVRFVQICHGGGGNGRWDAHDDIETHGPLCQQTDKPIAGLLRDLKQRGLLEQTLVVWTSEFGRTPWSQNTTGRDHNPRGFTSWLAGGGTRGGTIHGATDEVGYRAVEDRHYVADLQATILYLLGLDAHEMAIEQNGQPLRLVDEEEGATPIMEVVA